MSKPLASDQANSIVEVENLNMFYGETQALHDIDLSIPEREVTAFIGPSGCGKSTLLRCFNRLNDLIESARIEGSVRVSGLDIYAPDCDVIDLRRRVGMVFQSPIPSPSPSTRTWPMACASPEKTAVGCSTRPWRRA